MRLLALAAAASMSLAPNLVMAQAACPANAVLSGGVCVCADGFTLGAGGACVSTAAPDVVVAVDAGTTARGGLPVMGDIPPGAVVVGGLVLLAGVIIGIAAASDDDDAAGTTTTTTTN